MSREQDPAMFDQLQAEAMNLLRKHVVWFVFSVDEEMNMHLAIACPERVESETLTGTGLYRILLHSVMAAAADALVESIEEDE